MRSGPSDPARTLFDKFEEGTKRIFQIPKREVEKGELRKKKEREAREADTTK